MSAAHQSLTLDKALCAHYYHCVVYDIPFHTPVSEIAPHVAPRSDSDAVKQLTAAGCRVVPHQLHVYKEPLDAKFGYVSFFIHQLPNSSASAAEVHQLVVRWIDLDLTSQLEVVKCKVQLAQPPECHSSEPFLLAMEEKCPLLDPSTNTDTKRLETFVLTRVRFGTLQENASINEAAEAQRRGAASSSSTRAEEDEAGGKSGDEGENSNELCHHSHHAHCCRDHVWKCVGTFAVDTLSAKELLWLKKQLPSFPPLLITDGNMASAHCDAARLKDYFKTSLAPLITVADDE